MKFQKKHYGHGNTDMEKFNFKKIDKLIQDGYISERHHKDFPFKILNYTAKCQYESNWCFETLNCRGLILDEDNKIIARGMSKFFNYGEYGKDTKLGKELPPYKSFDVYEKLDGSLGILYTRPDGELAIATRGSFESDQALMGTKILQKKLPKLQINPDCTYLWEIIYPENRIVIDYGDETDLVLLAIIENATGKDIKRSHLESFARTWKCSITRMYDYKTVDELIDGMKKVTDKDKEGYVIQFNTGLRVKMKYEEYVRLHKIITGVNTKGIWEMMRDGESLESLIEKVPDEFHKWITETSGNFEKEYKKLEKKAEKVISKIGKDNPVMTRKEIAKIFLRKTNKEISGILFSMLDEKPYDKIIWKLIKPKQAKAFKEEI